MTFRDQQKLLDELLADRSLPVDAERPRIYFTKTTDGNHGAFDRVAADVSPLKLNNEPSRRLLQNEIMNETPKPNQAGGWLRRVLITLAVLATLVAVFYTEEDWRGKRAWENYKHEWEAKGEKFDWQSFVPPSVPDDQNFFTAPIFTNMLNGKIVMNPYGTLTASPNWPWPENDEVGYLGGEGRTRITDLKTWQATYRNPTNASLDKRISHRAAAANAGEGCFVCLEQIRFGG